MKFLSLMLVLFFNSSDWLYDITDPNCRAIKTGTFYFYAPDHKTQYSITRNNTVQKEVNLKTGEQSIWKMNWRSSCICELTFVSRSTHVNKEELLNLVSHKTIVQITQVTKDYYVFKAGMDNLDNPFQDTAWYKRKL